MTMTSSHILLTTLATSRRPAATALSSSTKTNNTIATTATSIPDTHIPTSTPTSLPHRSSSDGFSLATLAGILAAIALLLIVVFALGFMLRKHKRKAYRKMIEESTTSKSKTEAQRGIVVTKTIESRESWAKGNENKVRFEVERGKM
ncbi:hypothetical protein K504DRAFT_463592 [Pleomassaria siparia CBS 279.74]|uniref:Uncharacterized protein n=1 Tax=Pleomassaria siparia CBS 279.74 TaxID=1314801 RepID=A0A6G1JSK9_9PLEO|nr:hypothetical protein K504DRAFT_463592 [Pleomassaria siparia CBS 279.74]